MNAHWELSRLAFGKAKVKVLHQHSVVADFRTKENARAAFDALRKKGVMCIHFDTLVATRAT